MLFSELMLTTLIQRYDKQSFHFKNGRLTEILHSVICHILWSGATFYDHINTVYKFINPRIIKYLLLRTMEPFNDRFTSKWELPSCAAGCHFRHWRLLMLQMTFDNHKAKVQKTLANLHRRQQWRRWTDKNKPTGQPLKGLSLSQ